MLHTFKIMFLSYKQAYRKQPPGLHAHFTKRSSHQNWIIFIVYSLQFLLNFFLVSAFCETKDFVKQADFKILEMERAPKSIIKVVHATPALYFKSSETTHEFMLLLSAVVLKLRTHLKPHL